MDLYWPKQLKDLLMQLKITLAIVATLILGRNYLVVSDFKLGECFMIKLCCVGGGSGDSITTGLDSAGRF